MFLYLLQGRERGGGKDHCEEAPPIALFPNHEACSGHAGYCCHAVQSKGLSLGIRLFVWLKAHGELSCRALGSLY